MKITIHRAGLHDLEAVNQVNLSAYDRPIAPVFLRQYFDLFSETYLVAKHGEEND